MSSYKNTSKIDECVQQRLQSLEKWTEEEKAAAKKLHEGQLLAIENEVEKQIEDSKNRVFEVILLKYNLLNEKLPNAAKYFSSQEANQFIKTCNEEEANKSKKVIVELSNAPILPPDEVQKLLEEVQSAKIIASVSDGKLRVGDDVFTVGSTVVVTVNEDLSFTGSLREIDGNDIFFVPTGGQEMCFTVQAINSRLFKLSK